MSALRSLGWIISWTLFVSANAAPLSDESSAAAPGPTVLSNPQFQLQFRPGTAALTSLRHTGDPDKVNFIRPNGELGGICVRYRDNGEKWTLAAFAPSHFQSGQSSTGQAAWVEEQSVSSHRDLTGVDPQDLAMTQRWELSSNRLTWSIRLRNVGASEVEIGDLALPLPMNTRYAWDHDETFNRRVFKHASIAGAGSFLYWLPVKGSGSFLVLMPEDPTSLEFFTSGGMGSAAGGEDYSVFVHSLASAQTETGGSWRQPRTSKFLRPGEETECRFAFRWTDSYDGVRDLLYREGGVDLQVAPGMVVPQDLPAMLSVHTHKTMAGIESEFPEETRLEGARARGTNTAIYKLNFSHLGENLVTLHFGNGESERLEFFVTQPLETLIKKRAAFIVHQQQHRNPGEWYDGLYSLWDRRLPEGRNLLGPDNLGGEERYAVSGSDDPCNCKALFVAEKNVAYPDGAEIASVEYYLEHFVWGKLQRTDAEKPYAYGIYGSDSWRENRFAERDPLDKSISRPGGPSACHLWRTYDYTTLFALYYDMYRIARNRPDLVHYLDASEYLERAFGTAQAFFEVPEKIHMEGGWAFTGWVDWQYTCGNFHEKYLLPLIEALEANGRHRDADYLRGEWDKKVKYFIYDSQWPFASEMPFDSTAYESTYAFAKYALGNELKPDTNLWQDPNNGRWFSHPRIDPLLHTNFLIRQLHANLACRGVLEMNYWSLGSDFRGFGSANYTLSYMSQMGGWAILDYALHFDPHPAENLRLGYASLLSSWALMNAGDARTDYGFWTPGPLNDGAMSWGFQPGQAGPVWNRALGETPRGAWPVDGEADHGLVAGVEAACTVLFDDPIFGLFAYGGNVTVNGDLISVIPRDGVRQRFSAVLGDERLRLALDSDGFAPNESIVLDRNFRAIRFKLENRGLASHRTTLSIGGLPPGSYEIRGPSGKVFFEMPSIPDQSVDVNLGISAKGDDTFNISRA